uniref:Uncharacterized protein n=1 Tax=Eutreptiella gymnastica TaxID=73025 RepID=A0A7S1IB46_9EUGL
MYHGGHCNAKPHPPKHSFSSYSRSGTYETLLPTPNPNLCPNHLHTSPPAPLNQAARCLAAMQQPGLGTLITFQLPYHPLGYCDPQCPMHGDSPVYPLHPL